MANDFSGPVNEFHDRGLPEAATPTGYAALIYAYGHLELFAGLAF
jgi:hypothetical protein